MDNARTCRRKPCKDTEVAKNYNSKKFLNVKKRFEIAYWKGTPYP